MQPDTGLPPHETRCVRLKSKKTALRINFSRAAA
jgi:hypothetical protein